MAEEDGDFQRDEPHPDDKDDPVSGELRDRVRLAVIKIAESEAGKYGMEVSQPVVSCIADLAFKFTEQLAKDLELFMQHGGRKSVNMEDVIITAHRNEDLAATLRSFSKDLKEQEPQAEKKRKKAAKKEEKIVLD
ncbi:Centromere protein S [Nymphaea thermarum]|nr:Centromere protein S [Nymphaea thermarum]